MTPGEAAATWVKPSWRSRAGVVPHVAGYLDDRHVGADVREHVSGGHLSDATVVGATEGGVIVAGDVAVEDYDGDSARHHLVDDGRDGGGLVGGGDYYVETVVGKPADVLGLLLAGVVSRADRDLRVVVEHGLAEHLLVHSRAPVVLTTLGNAYAVFFLIAATRQ